jgi:hypothetical protein
MAIDVTPGGPDADGYVSLIDADAYHADRVDNDVWDTATDPDKETAIKNATRLLDLKDWRGELTFELGALRWPRTGIRNLDRNTLDGTLIPTFLENATAEWAFILLRDGDPLADPDSAGISALKVDVIEIEFETGAGGAANNPTQEPQGTPRSVAVIIAPYVLGSPFSMRVVRT